uniref:Ac45-VOA1_TM domain-containing protein n=1 Tax=Haemonchus contortus TaxID=6289 RepID=A0A6F7PH85_HAECO|nr:ATPase domain containing protein [Haemonchus contortus]
MRLLVVLIAVSSVTAHDAVVFSNDQKITKDFPSIPNLISTASSESPLVFLVNPDFTLGQFSREAAAYSQDKRVSGLPAVVKSSSHHASRYFSDSFYTPDAVVLTSPNNFVAGAKIYVLMGEEWASMQNLAEVVFPQIGDKYTGIITASDAVYWDKARVKRVVTSDMENDDAPSGSPSPDAAGGPDVAMPLNLPPYNRTEYPSVKPLGAGLGSCLLYMEGVNIVVQNSKKAFATIPIRSNETTWNYADGDVNCVNDTAGEYRFAVRLKLKADAVDAKGQVKISSGSQLMFTLVFTGAKTGFWQLTDVVANKLSVEGTSQGGFLSGAATAQEKVISPTSVQNVGFTSVQGFAIACSDSQAAFFRTNQENVLIGVSLYNTEVQPFAVYPDQKTQQMYFTRQVDDCVGTFSVGSWMAIVSILILLAGFIFGFLMLNSVQTMDRFDDPKHKQIVINVRE